MRFLLALLVSAASLLSVSSQIIGYCKPGNYFSRDSCSESDLS